MGKSTCSILGIQGSWFIKDTRRETDKLHLTLLQRRKTADCPRCRKRTKSGYDKQPERVVLHTTVGHDLVFLHLTPRRFVCGCNPTKPFRERLPGVSGLRQTTERFDRDFIRHLTGQAFKTVEEKLSLCYPSQRLRLTEAIDPLAPRWDLVAQLPEIHLGLDGHHVVNKRFAETITEVKQGIPLGILPDNRQSTIQVALATAPEEIRLKVRTINVDMEAGVITIARKIFPRAAIVIDHFHMIADANRRLHEARMIEMEVVNQERARKEKGKIEIPGDLLRKAREHLWVDKQEPERLVRLLTQFPRLKVWYEHKERLRDVYKAKDRQAAEILLTSLILAMKTSDDGNLIQWSNTLAIYKEEILNYFLYRTTNAYTEGLHVRCKLIQRISSGFRNVDVYIRKAMLVLLPLSVAVTGSVYTQHYPLPLS